MDFSGSVAHFNAYPGQSNELGQIGVCILVDPGVWENFIDRGATVDAATTNLAEIEIGETLRQLAGFAEQYR